MPHRALSLALLRQRLVSMLKAMPAAQAGDETSVHEARVASRRLREALPVLSSQADWEAINRAGKRVRRITRALGPVRELDVTLSLLAELEGKGAAPKRAITRVRTAVIEDRQKRRMEMLEEMTPSRLEKLRKRLVEVAAPEARGQISRDALVEAQLQASGRAKKLKLAIERAGGMYLADRLHRVRIEAKKLRYALEIQRELTRSKATSRLNTLKHQQDLLGRVHDLEILIERAREVQASLPVSNRRAMNELDKLIRALEDECREGHATYMRGRPALLKLCDSVIGAPADTSSSSAA
ncbi:MAG TPA: CHAD domain-containing protein [Vicinamibacterales bacterium]|nr:CHAD domain-containing protein [Vicinamibacterales bacterium]